MGDNRNKSTEKEEYREESNEVVDLEQAIVRTGTEEEEDKNLTDMNFSKVYDQYRENTEDLRGYLAMQTQNNEFMQQKLKSLTEELKRSEEEVRKLKSELRIATVKYENLELLHEELKKNEREVNIARDHAFAKLLDSAERLGEEKNESSRCRADIKDLKEKVELQKKKIANSKAGFTVILLLVTVVALTGWTFYFSI